MGSDDNPSDLFPFRALINNDYFHPTNARPFDLDHTSHCFSLESFRPLFDLLSKFLCRDSKFRSNIFK